MQILRRIHIFITGGVAVHMKRLIILFLAKYFLSSHYNKLYALFSLSLSSLPQIAIHFFCWLFKNPLAQTSPHHFPFPHHYWLLLQPFPTLVLFRAPAHKPDYTPMQSFHSPIFPPRHLLHLLAFATCLPTKLAPSTNLNNLQRPS